MARFQLPDLFPLPEPPPMPAEPGTAFQGFESSTTGQLGGPRNMLACAHGAFMEMVRVEGDRNEQLGQQLVIGQNSFNKLSDDIDRVDFTSQIAAALAADEGVAAGAREAAGLPGPLSFSDDIPQLGAFPQPPTVPTVPPDFPQQPPVTPAAPPPPIPLPLPVPLPTPPVPCAPGQVRNFTDGRCVPNPALNPPEGPFFPDFPPDLPGRRRCPPGSEIDPFSGLCTFPELPQKCPTGIDPFTGECISPATESDRFA